MAKKQPNLPEMISEARQKKKLSVSDLARHLQTSRQTVYAWESGQHVPKTARLVYLSSVLGISVYDLVEAAKRRNGD